MKHPKFIQSFLTVLIYFTVTRCPTILTFCPVWSVIFFAWISPRNELSSISNHVIETGKPSNSISSYASSILFPASSGSVKFLTGVENSERVSSCLLLFISIWASHSSTALFFPVNRNAPALISSITCSSPGLTLSIKSSSPEKDPPSSRIGPIDCASLYSRFCMWMNPIYMTSPYMVVM